MGILGKLVVKIGGDNDDLKKSINDAKGALSAGTRKMRESANEWGKWAAAGVAAGVAVGAAITKANLDAITALDGLAKASDMSVEAFQRSAFAAQQAGFDIEGYGAVLQDVNDRIGDFVTSGAGPMVDFFEKIGPKVGVTADQFKRLNGEEALALYVDSLEKANLSQKEMTFFMEAISSESTKLLPLFKNNAEALEAFKKEADELGIALTAVEVQQAKMAKAELSKTFAWVDSVSKQLTVELAPIITQIATDLNQAAKEAGGWGQVFSSAIAGVTRFLGVFADGWRGIEILIKGIEVAIKGMVAGAAGVLKGLDKAFTAIGVTIREALLRPLANALELIAPFSETAQAALDGVTGAIQSMGKESQTIDDMFESSLGGVKESAGELHDLLMQPLPSANMQEYVESAKKAFTEVAQAKVAAEQGEAPGTEDTGPTVAENLESQRILEENQAIIDALTERYEAEEMTQAEHFARMDSALAAHLENGLITKERYAQLNEQLEKEKSRFELDTLSSTLGALAQAMDLGGKKFFKIKQALAIGEAVISGWRAAVDAWSAGMATGGPWAPAVAAAYTAASIAKTAGMISNIRSASPGGGGSVSAGGGGTPAIPSQATQSQGGQQSEQQQAKTVTIAMEGSSMFSVEQVRQLIGQINEATGDGVELNVNTV